MGAWFAQFFVGIGQRTVQRGLRAWNFFVFTVEVAVALGQFFGRQGFVASARVAMQQVYFTGLEALPFLSMLSLLLGFTVIAQSLPQLQGVGAHALIGQILVISIVRELGPLITAMVVITRSGTAMAAQMATNRVTGEVEALEGMGISIHRYLVVPRVLGSVISLFCMIVYFDAIALIGGFLVASTRLTMPFSLYLDYIFASLSSLDLYLSLTKGVLFGTGIALFSCYHGLRARRAAFEVPMVARSGVIQSMFFVFVSSALISALFYWI
jgi:phospholipid/cholesterol/gamma-HCH transport system permease protein